MWHIQDSAELVKSDKQTIHVNLPAFVGRLICSLGIHNWKYYWQKDKIYLKSKGAGKNLLEYVRCLNELGGVNVLNRNCRCCGKKQKRGIATMHFCDLVKEYWHSK